MKKPSPLLALLLLLGPACRDGTGPGNPTPSAVRGEVTAGDRQTGTVGDTLGQRVMVRVTDAGGRPVPDVTLEWRVVSERGGEIRFPLTRTDVAGRAANAWMLGTRPGDHLAEVAAVLEGRREVLDTVYATAKAGAPQRLELVGDTARFAALDDTLRLTVRGEDRFGNAIPAAELRPRWSSDAPDVASVDSAGAVRAVGHGSAVLSAAVGSAVARLRLVVDARMEVFQVLANTPQHITFAQNGTRLVALAEEARYPGGSFTWGLVAFDFDNGRWSARDLGTTFSGWYYGSLHVTPGGTAYAAVGNGLFSSAAPQAWGRVLEWLSAAQVDGVGNTLFLLAPRPGSTSRDSMTVYRSSGGTTVDLQLPRSVLTYQSFSTLAAAGENEVYVTPRSGPLMYWNGSAWSAVQGPSGEFAGAIVDIVSHPEGGPVLAGGERGGVFLLRAGRAEAVSNPFTDRGISIRKAALSRDGQPYLISEGSVAFRTAAGWKQYALRGDWYGRAIWPDTTPGVVWVAVNRRMPTSASGAQSELLFVRIRTGQR